MRSAQREPTPSEDPHAGPLNTSTRLAFDRTRLAHDRTMLAWVRTATSLITFGFSFYKFFEFDIKRTTSGGLIGPREFALIMITTGLASLMAATVQHRRDRNALKEMNPEIPRSQAAAVAALIGILGVLALAAVLFRQ